jgi:hypothetical protein
MFKHGAGYDYVVAARVKGSYSLIDGGCVMANHAIANNRCSSVGIEMKDVPQVLLPAGGERVEDFAVDLCVVMIVVVWSESVDRGYGAGASGQEEKRDTEIVARSDLEDIFSFEAAGVASCSVSDVVVDHAASVGSGVPSGHVEAG